MIYLIYATWTGLSIDSDLNLGTTPEDAMEKLRDRLRGRRDAALKHLQSLRDQLELAENMPEIKDVKP